MHQVHSPNWFIGGQMRLDAQKRKAWPGVNADMFAGLFRPADSTKDEAMFPSLHVMQLLYLCKRGRREASQSPACHIAARASKQIIEPTEKHPAITAFIDHFYECDLGNTGRDGEEGRVEDVYGDETESE